MRYVYIVRCKDNSLYTGITTDIERRLNEHNNESLWAKYTKGKRPVTLVWSTSVENRSEASKIERKIKKMRKEEKEILIIS